MQKSIAEVEDQIEKKVVQQTDKSIQAVHQHLGAFELRVLACPTPTIDLITLPEVLANMRENVDSIHEMRGHQPETAPIELVKDTMLAVPFSPPNAPPLDPCERSKRHRSRSTTEG